MQNISICLWFDKNAEEAVNYYLSIFKDSKILRVTHYGKEGYEIHKMPDGTILTIEFILNGQKFVALNGGPVFKFNEAVSIIVNCASQKEIDHYWDHLTVGGDERSQQCGWLKDKYGLSWQIVPTILDDLLHKEDNQSSRPVMKAMMDMKKIDIKTLEEAARKI
ncbi:MAG: VOC family protein [Bacteroidia bacterium]